MADVIVEAFDIVESSAKLGHSAAETAAEATGCCSCSCMRTKIYYLIYVLLLFVDVVTDTVEVALFAPEESYKTTRVKNLTYTWITCVAVSWAIFIYEIYIIYFSYRLSKATGVDQQANGHIVLDRMKTVHLILVMVVEDILICIVGVWLVVIVPGQSLTGIMNQISVCITILSCLLQYINVAHRSGIAFRRLGRPKKCCKCLIEMNDSISCKFLLYILLAAFALGVAIMKGIFVFQNVHVQTGPAPNHDFSSTTPLVTTYTLATTTENSYSETEIGFFLMIFFPTFALIGFSCTTFMCIRTYCANNCYACQDPSCGNCLRATLCPEDYMD